jgi:hypothetical protein
LIDVQRTVRVTLSAGTLVACLAAGTEAAAQPAPLRLDYEVAAGCPEAGAFTAEVRARAASSSASLANRAIAVKITSSAGGSSAAASFEGSVVITDDSGVTPSRAVRGDTCDEVVRALALTVAMTLDPEERPPTVIIAAVSEAAPPPAEKPPAVAALPSRSGVHLSAGVRGGAESGVGPLLAPALGIYGDVAVGNLALRIGGVRAVSPLVERGAGAARFARTTATLDACPFRWRPSPSVALVPCAGFEIGSLTSDGRATVDPESVARLWSAAGLVERVVWEPVGPLVIELEGRATVPLTRDRFYFRPADDVFEAPILAFSAGLTAGVRFW